MIAADVTVDISRILKKVSTEECDAAIDANIDSVAADVTKIVPKDSGELRRSLVAARVGYSKYRTALQWRVPYAARQYWTNKRRNWVPYARKRFGQKWAGSIGKTLCSKFNND